VVIREKIGYRPVASHDDGTASMDARNTGWRRGRVLADAERHQESERNAAGARLHELAQSWDGPTAGWPLPPNSDLRAGSAPYYQDPDPASLRRQARAMYVVAVLFLGLAVALGVALAWGP